MKQIIFYELMRSLKHKPHLKRKLKILAVVGIVGFFTVSALIIWAGISAVGLVASKANQAVQSPATQQHLENLKAEIQSMTKVQALSCWVKAQSLMAVEPWLARPAMENLRNLKVACLEERPANCEGQECSQIKQVTDAPEGEFT